MLTLFIKNCFLEHCAAKYGSLMDLVPSPNHNNLQSQAPLSGETHEVDAIVQQAISHNHNDLISVADFLYQLANEKLVGCVEFFFKPSG